MSLLQSCHNTCVWLLIYYLWISLIVIFYSTSFYLEFCIWLKVHFISWIRLHFGSKEENFQGIWLGKQFDEVIILHTWHIRWIIKNFITTATDRSIHEIWWFIHVLKWVSKKDSMMAGSLCICSERHWPQRNSQVLLKTLTLLSLYLLC